MKILSNITRLLAAASLRQRAGGCLLFLLLTLSGCIREPELYLPDGGDTEVRFPFVALELETYWNYEMIYGVTYDWKAEWLYEWDEEDKRIFGELGYVEPTVFNLRRYYTGTKPYTPHTSVSANTVTGNTFNGKYNWGFWDILVWNDIHTIDGVQSLNFDETTSLDYVTAYTNPTMRAARYQAPKYTRAFYAPEPLFSAYETGVEINRNLEGFDYDAERDIYIKKLSMMLEPITYIYLTQVILINNNNKIIGVDGAADLSGMARSVVVNTGTAGTDPVTVYYNSRFKKSVDTKKVYDKYGKPVDIAGGRLLTFGICGLNANRVGSAADITDENHHFMDVNMQFNNGMDSTFVFDVSDQVRKRYKGGVITIEIDMDTVKIPTRSGGSAFDAVVKDFEDGGTHEFEM